MAEMSPQSDEGPRKAAVSARSRRKLLAAGRARLQAYRDAKAKARGVGGAALQSDGLGAQSDALASPGSVEEAGGRGTPTIAEMGGGSPSQVAKTDGSPPNRDGHDGVPSHASEQPQSTGSRVSGTGESRETSGSGEASLQDVAVETDRVPTPDSSTGHGTGSQDLAETDQASESPQTGTPALHLGKLGSSTTATGVFTPTSASTCDSPAPMVVSSAPRMGSQTLDAATPGILLGVHAESNGIPRSAPAPHRPPETDAPTGFSELSAMTELTTESPSTRLEFSRDDSPPPAPTGLAHQVGLPTMATATDVFAALPGDDDLQARIAANRRSSVPAPEPHPVDAAVPAGNAADHLDQTDPPATTQPRSMALAYAEICAQENVIQRLREDNEKLQAELAAAQRSKGPSSPHHHGFTMEGSQAQLLSEVVDAPASICGSPSSSQDARASPSVPSVPSDEKWSDVKRLLRESENSISALTGQVHKAMGMWRSVEDLLPTGTLEDHAHHTSLRQHIKSLLASATTAMSTAIATAEEMGDPVPVQSSLVPGQTGWLSEDGVERLLSERFAVERKEAEALLSDHLKLQTKLDAYQVQVRALTRDLATARRDSSTRGKRGDGTSQLAAAAAAAAASQAPIVHQSDSEIWSENSRLRQSVVRHQQLLEEKTALAASLRSAVGVAAEETARLSDRLSQTESVRDDLLKTVNFQSRKLSSLEKASTQLASELVDAREENASIREGVDAKERRIHELLGYIGTLESSLQHGARVTGTTTPAKQRRSAASSEQPSSAHTPSGVTTVADATLTASTISAQTPSFFGATQTPSPQHESMGISPVPLMDSAGKDQSMARSHTIEATGSPAQHDGKSPPPRPATVSGEHAASVGAVATGERDSLARDVATLEQTLALERAAHDQEKADLEARVAALQEQLRVLTAQLRSTMVPNDDREDTRAATSGADAMSPTDGVHGAAHNAAVVTVGSIIAPSEHVPHAAMYRKRVEQGMKEEDDVGFWRSLMDLVWPLLDEDEDVIV